MSEIRNKYHIAINSVGYMLKGAPGHPAYLRSVVPSQINRLAISDLAYSNFAGQGIFYKAQTDWSAGIKVNTEWKDDAKYYYSTNIDAYSNQGEITTEKEIVLDSAYTTSIYFGSVASVNNSVSSYLGTYQNSSGNITIYRDSGSGWTDISGTTFTANQYSPSYAIGSKETLWVGTVGVGNTNVVVNFDGTTWTDNSAAIITAMGWSGLSASRSAIEIAGILYVGVENYVNNEAGIVSTSDNGTTWVKEVNLGYRSVITSMANYNSKLYYLTQEYPFTTLRVYDPSLSIDVEVISFDSNSSSNISVYNTLLVVYGGKLIITVPTDKIYEYDGANLKELFVNKNKTSNYSYEATAFLDNGAVRNGDNLYWGNLVYNGTEFFNYKKPLTSERLYPLFSDYNNNLFYKVVGDDNNLYKDDSTYKSDISKNFLVFNEMSPVVSIDKLLYSITAIFNSFNPNDEIKIEYSIDNRKNWVVAGDLTYNSVGTDVKREIVIPGSILFNKIWWKVSLANTAGSAGPVLLDLIMAYKPIPNYKNKWEMRLDFSDDVKLLNKQNDKREGNEMNSQLWNEKLLKRQVKLEDIDYVECTLQTAMSKTQTSAKITEVRKLPSQGRIRAVSGGVSEEMYYTSADIGKILGINRGMRGTIARAYTSGQVFNNGYNVYVNSIATSLNFTDEKKTESIAQVVLIES